MYKQIRKSWKIHIFSVFIEELIPHLFHSVDFIVLCCYYKSALRVHWKMFSFHLNSHLQLLPLHPHCHLWHLILVITGILLQSCFLNFIRQKAYKELAYYYRPTNLDQPILSNLDLVPVSFFVNLLASQSNFLYHLKYVSSQPCIIAYHLEGLFWISMELNPSSLVDLDLPETQYSAIELKPKW